MPVEALAQDNALSQPSGLVEQVMSAIKEQIRAEKLATGDALPSENALALEFGVSRAVVREAFRSLAALKLIDIGNGRRARVSGIDPTVLGLVLDHAVHTNQITIQQIYDVRRTIEIRTVALAALRRDDEEAAEILARAEAMAADFATPDKVMAHDIAFHEAIARASRNPLFALIVGSFHVVTRQTWGIGWASRPNDEERRASVACHREIGQAILKRDPRVATAAMADHFDLSVKALLAAGVN
jgi:GntR family transcriptional regulator, transcriptional repressor for pyruvate dehydrogenase complex